MYGASSIQLQKKYHAFQLYKSQDDALQTQKSSDVTLLSYYSVMTIIVLLPFEIYLLLSIVVSNMSTWSSLVLHRSNKIF